MLFYRTLLMNPHWLKTYTGTVAVTSIGMFVHGGGWGIPFTPLHTLTLTVGNISEKPALIKGNVMLREYLSVTISVDHLIVDGAPIACFAQQFKELIEVAYGLK